MSPRARNTDPLTSHEAAASIGEDELRASQQAIYILFARIGRGGMTDEDLVEHYMKASQYHPEIYPYQSESGIRTRRSELVRRGMVAASGERGITRSGRPCTIWKIVDVNA